MHVGHGLSGGGPSVEANVIAIGLWLEPLIEQPFHLANELYHSGLLRSRAVEVGRHHPPRDHEHVPRRNWKRIEDREAEIIRAEPLRLGDSREGRGRR